MPRFYPRKPQTPLAPDSDDLYNDPIKTYFSWKALSRPFRKKDRSYFTTIATIVVLLILISILAQEFLLVGVLLTLAFVAYVLGFTPPEEVDYKISSQGVTICDRFYFWDELDSFWFSEKDGFAILHLLTFLRFPGQLMMVLEKQADEEEIKRIVARFLPYHEIPPKSLVDGWGEALQRYFPLETPHR